MDIVDRNETDRIYERIHESFYSQSFLKLLGAELEYVEKGRVVISCENKESLHQQNGFMHGGFIASLADVAGGYAALTVMPEDADVLSSEFKINFLRPASANKLFAIGDVIKSGKTLVVVEVSVMDEEDVIIAKMLATMYVVK
ncbi:MAG: PaaI family thioesterase [Tissierellia bacterium]|nr:PaaI family thioesterase [Tissierellia bacterium]